MNSGNEFKSLSWITYTAVLFGMILLLNGCTTKRPVSLPVPTFPQQTPTPSPAPAPTPPPGVVYSPTYGPAESLYHAAENSLAAGDTQKAELTMERALRIEPRNGHYWYTMARIKYEQREYNQTIQLCLKSKSLAGRNKHLVTLNDNLMSKARTHVQ